MTTYLECSLNHIQASPTNPRKSFPAEDMAEMIDSVKRHGVIQPVLVRRWPDKYTSSRTPAPMYELVAGERRYRAAIAAELESITIMVRDLSDHEVLEIQIIENLQRKGLHPIEEAESYALMINDHGYNADQLAEKIGKSRAYIYGRMKLTALCMSARLAFRDRKLTASTALLIARIPSADLQIKALDDITAGYNGILSYRDAARTIQNKYCLDLDRASFPQENLLLVPAAGGCSTCPKRSGTYPERFPDIEDANVCTDPSCHQAKGKAWVAYQKREAEDKGLKVIIGEEAAEIDIRFSSNKYLSLDKTNYDAPLKDGQYQTNRQLLEEAGIDLEPTMIEDTRHAQLVEAVDKKVLAEAFKKAGITVGNTQGEKDKENEAPAKAENEFRSRLYAEIRQRLAKEFEEDFREGTNAHPTLVEHRLIARQFWACTWSETQKRVAQLWIETSEASNANERVKLLTDRIPGMNSIELNLILIDMSIIGQTWVVAHNLDSKYPDLMTMAAEMNVSPGEIRLQIAAEKAGKSSPASTAKPTSTPQQAPLGGESVREEKAAIRLIVGDIVRVKDDAVAVEPDGGGWALTARGKVGSITARESDDPLYVVVKFEKGGEEVLHQDNLLFIASPVTTPTPSKAARQPVMYAHPENAELQWTGRGRKPKWVEAWLATDGQTLEQLRKATAEEEQSSASGEANAKLSMAEAMPRCNKTLELPLA